MNGYQKNPPPVAVFADLHGILSRLEKIRRFINEGINRGQHP